MSKELTITGKITLPNDMFDQAQLLTRIRDAIVTAEAAIETEISGPFKFQTDIVTPRTRSQAPAEGAAQPARRSRANGAAEAAAAA